MEAWKSAASWYAHHGLKQPAVDTWYRIQKELPVTLKYRGRMTGSAYKSLLPYVARDVSMFKANDLWVGDGHSFKAKVQSPIHGQPFTPEVTIILDWVSRKIVGWSVDTAESCIAVSAALRHAHQQTRARPLIYYSDNGSGQTAKQLDNPIHGTLARLGIAHETGIPGNPQGRGVIERLWQTVTYPLARTYPTYTGKKGDQETIRKMLQALNRKDGSSERLLPSFGQFLLDLEAAINHYNSAHKHRDLGGMTPNEAYQAKLDPDSIDMGITDQELATMWLPGEVRTPQRGLVTLFGNEYANKDLVNLLAEGEKVIVRFDIHNADKVWLTRIDGRYLGEAIWDGHKREAFPVSYVDQKREERAEGKISRAERDISEARAELGNVIAGEVLNPVIFDPIEREPELVPVQFDPVEREEKMSHNDTMQWLWGNPGTDGDGECPANKVAAL
jgi:putative transposase